MAYIETPGRTKRRKVQREVNGYIDNILQQSNQNDAINEAQRPLLSISCGGAAAEVIAGTSAPLNVEALNLELNECDDAYLNGCSSDDNSDHHTNEDNSITSLSEHDDSEESCSSSSLSDNDGSDESCSSLSDHLDSNLQSELCNWATKNGTTYSSLSELLGMLRKLHPELPKDPRTLLGTKVKYVTSSLSGGSYYHFGIKNGILKTLTKLDFDMCTSLELQVNVDGLPLFKSSNDQFWPILGLIINCSSRKPFVVGLFYGQHKPETLDFLNAFVEEAVHLQKEGLVYNDILYDIRVVSVVCDAPARALVKNIKMFSDYHGCDRCTQPGVYLQKMTFPKLMLLCGLMKISGTWWTSITTMDPLHYHNLVLT
ncbi:hypothetical protein HOLleu_11790 [Holothuria leucospilota]|uniref:Transposase domain-containing protein n=1 Tax=Holothuria leucospilota TaxID=206669 RepID=A0A9Q1C9X9_HOLLE|nr:hypothetical protein HOLleu_11790 [Holothuria leucospilota]